jgi:hypothetical protein
MTDERARKVKIKASPSAEQAAGVISWLRRRLEERLAVEGYVERRVDVASQLTLLALHSTVKPMSEYDQRVYPFRAFCVSESWVCYGDGKDFVQAPCVHVRMLARQFADEDGFPRLLAVDDDEIAAAVRKAQSG